MVRAMPPADSPPHPMTSRMSLSPQSRALGLEVVATDPQIVLKVPYRADLVGEPDTGVIAGGVVTTLLDMSCGWATALALKEPTSFATLDLRIDYMRPAEPGRDLLATAHCYKLTRSVAFLRAVAYDADPSDPVAAAQAAFILDSNAGRGPGANLEPPRARKGRSG
jgi:uncharacterized protein (TIGR00369 family)